MSYLTIKLAKDELEKKYLVYCKQQDSRLFVRFEYKSNLTDIESKIKKITPTKQIILNSIHSDLFYVEDNQIVQLGVEINSKDFFRKIQNIFSGKQVALERNKDIIRFMKIIKYFQINSILNSFFSDLSENKDQYDIFTLFSISQEFQLHDLQKQCVYQLSRFKFEQLNFNRYELLQSSKQTFEKILKLNQQHLKKNTGRGLSIPKMKQIVQQYCQSNFVWIEIESFYKSDLQQIQQEEQSQVDFIGQEEYAHIFPQNELQISLNLSDIEKQTNHSSQICEFDENDILKSSLKSSVEFFRIISKNSKLKQI